MSTDSATTHKLKEMFLLGAGFSKACNASMPLMKDLSEKILNADEFEKYRHFGDVESLLTFLSRKYPWEEAHTPHSKKADYVYLTQVIGAIVNDSQSVAHETPSQNLENFVKYIHENQSHVLTLNYDTLIELCYSKLVKGAHPDSYYPMPFTPASKRMEGSIIGGGSTPCAQIYKLHGSLNMYYSGNDNFFGESIYISATPFISRAQANKNVYFSAKQVSDKVNLIVPPHL
ncbi:MAG: hypothetical protein HRT44_05735 [Bdellovibrionales bacterium]|nr:hypothetical protein [Bdellovibrionales bacterium]